MIDRERYLREKKITERKRIKKERDRQIDRQREREREAAKRFMWR